MFQFAPHSFLTGTVYLLDLASLALAATSKDLALLLKVAAHLASHQFPIQIAKSAPYGVVLVGIDI